MVDTEGERQNLLEHLLPQLPRHREGTGSLFPFKDWRKYISSSIPAVSFPREPNSGEDVLFTAGSSNWDEDVHDELTLTYLDVVSGRPVEHFCYYIPYEKYKTSTEAEDKGYVMETITRCSYEDDPHFVFPHRTYSYLPFVVTNQIDRIWNVDPAGRKSAHEVVITRRIFTSRSEGYLGQAPCYTIGESYLRKVTENFRLALGLLPAGSDLWLEGNRSYFIGDETITYTIGDKAMLNRDERGSGKPNWQMFYEKLDDVCVRVFPKRWKK